eukprot:2161912-Pleurochrysis_carterae.AAC.2
MTAACSCSLGNASLNSARPLFSSATIHYTLHFEGVPCSATTRHFASDSSSGALTPVNYPMFEK